MNRTQGRRAAVAAATLMMVIVAALGTTGASKPAATPVRLAAPGVWRVTTMEHMDLWLHGFAMLTSDSGRVPFFLRGYKQQITGVKRQQNAFTLLDANQKDLSSGFVRNPGLTNAQFIAMYFPSFQAIVAATNIFVNTGGQARSRDTEAEREQQILASTFRSAADRDWLRRFVQSLEDENTKFYHAYWAAEQQRRQPGYQAFQEAWASKYYPKLSRFLNNTQQSSGEIALSLTLGGEGRTVNDGKQSNIIAVQYPSTPDEASYALFAFAHEAVASLVDEVIKDNSSPADVREGRSGAYVGNGAVRGGYILIQKIAPELASAYMRYYVRTMGLEPAPNDLNAVFVSGFQMPDAMLTALSRQIDIVLGGI